jgi:hypothetical protein
MWSAYGFADGAYLVERELTVKHYDVADSAEPG